MGVSMAMALALLVSINYIGVRFNQNWDLTAEGLNSLSPQSKKVLKKLDDEIEFLVFYAGETERSSKKIITDTLELYKNASRFVKISPIDAVVEKQTTIIGTC